MSQPEINPIEDWSSEELSEVELDVLAGGRTISREDLFTNNVILIDAAKLILNIDSSYTSYQGALGTKGNEASRFYTALPFNITTEFP